MADIFLSIDDLINDRDFSTFKSRLETMAPDDQITIRMEASDAHQADIITSILEQEGFDYQPHGSHSGRDYLITAKRKQGTG